MTRRSVGLASLTGLLLLAAFWLGRTSAPVGPAATPRPARESAASAQTGVLDADGAELETARARIRELEAQVVWLRAQLDSLRQAGAEADRATAPTPSGTQAADGRRGSDGSELDESESGVPEFDAAEFLASGVPPDEVERLRRLFEKTEMERIQRELELERRALGEKLLDRRRDQKELVELELATRAEIGDEAYDAMLYESGANNAVRIRALLENSPGRDFGLQVGDEVLRYDGRHVFSPQELRQITNEGDPGELITVDVLRDGEIVHLEGLGGPIGVRSVRARVDPVRWWQ